MGCFSCFESSKDSKKSVKSKNAKPCREEGLVSKRKRRVFCCIRGGKSPKDGQLLKNEGLPKKKKESRNCFMCKRSSKDGQSLKTEGLPKKKERRSCFMWKRSSPKDGQSLKNEGLPKKKESKSCFMCKRAPKDRPLLKKEGLPKKKEIKNCFMCKRSPKDERPPKKKGNFVMCCFRSKQVSKDEALPKKQKECTNCCLHWKKTSKDGGLVKKERKYGMCCFGSNKKRLPEETTKRKEKASRSCSCYRSSKGRGCFSWYKSRKNEEPRKTEDKAIVKPSDGKPSKEKCKKHGYCCGKPSKKKCVKQKNCSCGCACCSSSVPKKKKKNATRRKIYICWRKRARKEEDQLATLVKAMSFESNSRKHRTAAEEILRIGNGHIAAKVFMYHELKVATQEFAPTSLVGKGGFGKVYKGYLRETNQTIAVKQLDKKGCQGNREFLIEVLMLSLLSHRNLVNLLGYCTDSDQRILVYDYMPNGSLQNHLHDLSPDCKPLSWNTRMRVACGAAKGLEHLHDAANPPVIYRDLKSSNILLDEDFNPRLADFGLAKLGPVAPNNHVSTRVMGTFGYCAPEYMLTGKLTKMSDVYSFGVLLLELVTGRKATDTTRPRNEQILIEWAAPLFKDKRNFIGMADPVLGGKFPVKALYQAVAVAAMCLQDEDSTRPLIKDVVNALQYLTVPQTGNSIDESEDFSIRDNITSDEQRTGIAASDGRQIGSTDSDERRTRSTISVERRSEGTTSRGNADQEEPRRSSDSDWQSCSTSREFGEEAQVDADVQRLDNEEDH